MSKSDCGLCKEPFGPGDFCINCGSSLEDSLAEHVMPRAKREKREHRKQLRIKHRGKLRFLFVLGLFGAVYGTAHFTIDAITGPDSTIDRYVSAIQSSSSEVLNDQTLFPGAQSSLLTDYLLQARIPGSLGEVRTTGIQRTGGVAIATVVSKLGEQQLELKAQNSWVGIFAVPKWFVVTDPLTFDFRVSPQEFGLQDVFLGNSSEPAEKSIYDSLVRGSKNLNLLPGEYSISLSQAGFYGGSKSSFVAWDGELPNAVTVKSDVRNLSSKDANKIKTDASTKLKRCVSAKCANLAKPGEYDFDLWLQFASTGYKYTSSKFDRSYTFKSCSAPKLTVSSTPTEAKAITECTYEVTGHLYVRYTYYRGYYSDYWYYWDFYDTIVKKVQFSTPVLTNIEGSKTSVGTTIFK